MASRLPVLLLIACALALGWILQPFWGAILWAVIIALIFLPMFRRMLPRVGGRRSLAAGLVLGVVVLIGVLPLTLLAASLFALLDVGFVFAVWSNRGSDGNSL